MSEVYAKGKCSRPDGYKIKKKKKNSARSLGNMEEKKRGKNEVGKQLVGEKKRAIKRARARNQTLLYSYGK